MTLVLRKLKMESMAAHAQNHSLWEVEAGGSQEVKAISGYRVNLRQPGLLETLSQKLKKHRFCKEE